MSRVSVQTEDKSVLEELIVALTAYVEDADNATLAAALADALLAAQSG